MKYMIHACNDRMWYVDEFLVPSMLKQGISEDDIYIYQDVNCDGNLVSFVVSCHKAYELWGIQNVWHLQDDVVICSDFKERTEELESFDGVICAFTCNYDEDNRKPGYGTVIKDIWWSFPCIRIPNDIAKAFATWTDTYVWRDNQYGFWIRRKKGDDVIFRIYMESYHTNDKILNLAPNLVDHVDYLLGGSMVNRQRTMKNVRSLYWEEDYIVDELAKQIDRRNNQ